ncbi:dTDP-4-dehydrorhamnose reductase [Deinococcus altitudinis]|uniref:dTDP-4-dehydrorhamnose reductase n=1 Tax=Deinococcus altitudinis TaxID=468914 RepID=UPI0038926EC3
MRSGAGAVRPAADQQDKLELWVGPEASFVRVGEAVTDQQALSGFGVREGDLERMASLGAGRVRFPLLWEREEADRTWAAAALPRLRELGVKPILGLVHHGGGAVPTGILDEGFAEGLAAYAGRVARRFPGEDAYTPVNEPLTTARFSALYGVWHPHASGDRAFVRALLNQLRGTVLSMQAVREVNSQAALIQTEDMGRVHGTPALAEQVEFENLRRWLSFDLLCGRVDERHGLWTYLLWAGATPQEVLWFAEHPCPPEVLGLNVYPTSERYLDERLDRHPARSHGSNGRTRYADVEAVRVRAELPGLFFERLMEAHERYGLPMALTEVHLGCTREEQLRWLYSGWQEALRARAAGAEVLAVTAWSAFGSYDWNSLLTRSQGHYEPGLWDVSGERPRETALATLARNLASGWWPAAHPSAEPDLGRHAPLPPVFAGPGWWQRADRLLVTPDEQPVARPTTGRPVEVRPGPLALGLELLCLRRGLPVLTDVPVPVQAPDGSDLPDASAPHAPELSTQPWARLEAVTPDTLRLDWLGQGTLVVRGVPLTDHHLDTALDLLIDGQTGLWLWNGQAFAPLTEQFAYTQSDRPLKALR